MLCLCLLLVVIVHLGQYVLLFIYLFIYLFHCCRRYGLAVDDVWLATPEGISRAVESSYDIVHVCTARMILELVFIRCGFLKFSVCMYESIRNAPLLQPKQSRVTVETVILIVKLTLLSSFYVLVIF